MRKLVGVVVVCILTFSILGATVVRFDIKNDDEACTSVIVTGTASEGGYAMLSKNRDSGDTANKPVYHAPTGGHYGYVLVNDLWMGMNERGLAVMNTYLGSLRFEGVGLDNGPLNEWIVQHCETVDQVCFELNSTAGEIGPGKRVGGTCVGVVDRFGKGAFIEISGIGAYARFIVNGFDSEANHPRYYPGYASGPSGRDQYALDIMNEIAISKGKISYEDVVQEVTRYVHNKEQGTASFSVSGEIPNDSTQASFVAVSGIAKYNGKLNCFWGEYGNNPIVGLYIPSIVFAGSPPAASQNLYGKVSLKKSYALNGTSYFLPERVREVQSYAFAAEDYTFEKYENLLSTIPAGLSDTELASRLRDYVSDAVDYAVNTYTLGVPSPARVDISITGLTTLKTVIGQEYTETVNVTFENQGNTLMLFNFTVYANSTVIYSELVTLPVINQTQSFKWNTTTCAYGNYTLEAVAERLPEEIDISDNNCTCSFAVHVGVPGDISGPTQGVYDGKCDMRDVSYLTIRFNSKPGSTNWNPNADVNGDNTVNTRDIQIPLLNFNKHE